MSKKIYQIIEVINKVKKSYNGDPYSISRLRQKAENIVGSRLGIYHSTVSDKFRRGLEPDIWGTGDFDRLLKEYFCEKSDRLKNILLKHGSDSEDKSIIEEFFKEEESSKRVKLNLEIIETFGTDQIHTMRASVPGGWLIFCFSNEMSMRGITFYPDTNHEWK